MPYIKQLKRDDFDSGLCDLIDTIEFHKFNPGDLNFIITSILNAAWNSDPVYSKGNELMGVLECVKQEFYRRKLVPYEDTKIKENGDVI